MVCEFVYNGTSWVWLNRDTNTTYTGATLNTSVAKTGSGSTVTNTIAASTSLNDVVGTLLNNDYALNTQLTNSADFSLAFVNGVCSVPAGSASAIASIVPIGSPRTVGLFIENLTPLTYKAVLNDAATDTIMCRITYVNKHVTT